MTLIVLNFKTYRESTGVEALRLAEICEDVSKEYSVQMVVVPQVADIHAISEAVKIPVYAQHVDGFEPGARTGHVTADVLKLAGAAGSLINHSERRLSLADIETSIRALQMQKLVAVVCSNNEATSAGAAALAPDYVAIEPPELIGSGVSVSKANPEIIRRSVAAVHAVNPMVKVLTGAGIQSGECGFACKGRHEKHGDRCVVRERHSADQENDQSEGTAFRRRF